MSGDETKCMTLKLSRFSLFLSSSYLWFQGQTRFLAVTSFISQIYKESSTKIVTLTATVKI